MADPLRALLSKLMPWYDPEEARQHDQLTEEIRQRSIRTRRQSERLRLYADHLRLASYARVRLPGRR